MSSDPSGNGETRGNENAGQMGSPLPGTRPERAAANNRRNADFLGQTPVAAQDGFGTEDMQRSANYLTTESVRPSDAIAEPLDLMSMGDAGQTFGGN